MPLRARIAAATAARYGPSANSEDLPSPTSSTRSAATLAHLVQQEGRALATTAVAAAQDFGEEAAGGLVHFGRGGAQLASLVDAHDHASGLRSRGAAALYAKFHLFS